MKERVRAFLVLVFVSFFVASCSFHRKPKVSPVDQMPSSLKQFESALEKPTLSVPIKFKVEPPPRLQIPPELAEKEVEIEAHGALLQDVALMIQDRISVPVIDYFAAPSRSRQLSYIEKAPSASYSTYIPTETLGPEFGLRRFEDETDNSTSQRETDLDSSYRRNYYGSRNYYGGLSGVSNVVLKDEKNDPKLTIRFKGPLKTLLLMISELTDSWIYYEDGIIKIKPERVFSIQIPVLLQSFSSEFRAEDVYGSAVNEDLKKMIEDFCRSVGAKVISISTQTGYLQVLASPRMMEQISQFLNTEVANESRFVSINVHILQLTLSEINERTFTLTRLIDMAAKAQGIIKVNPIAKTEGTAVTSFEIHDPENLYLLLRYISTFGRTEIVSTPTLVTANGIPAVLNLKKEIGWWLPGDVEDVNIGDASARVRQGRPEWESEDIGLTLSIRPKIIDNPKSVYLDIYFSNSEVYDFIKFKWQADPRLEPVTLQKPVISETKVLTRAQIKEGEYLLLAGLERSNLSEDEAFPRKINRRKKKTKSYLLIIISVKL